VANEIREEVARLNSLAIRTECVSAVAWRPDWERMLWAYRYTVLGWGLVWLNGLFLLRALLSARKTG
jgi:hypothetical protein